MEYDEIKNSRVFLDINLKAIDKKIDDIKEEMKVANNVFDNNLRKSVAEISGLLTRIGEKI